MRNLYIFSTMILSLAAWQGGAEKAQSRPAKPEAKKERAKAGDTAPEFTVKTLDGKETTLAALRGEKKDKIVVISFWSHCCPWSRAWDAELSKIAKDYSSKNVVVVAIDSNKEGHTDGTHTDNAASITEYKKKNSLNFDVYLDPMWVVADAFGGETTPDVFVIGTDGKIQYSGQINDMENPGKPDQFGKNYLREALDASIAGKAVENKSTPPKGCGIKRGKRETVKQ